MGQYTQNATLYIDAIYKGAASNLVPWPAATSGVAFQEVISGRTPTLRGYMYALYIKARIKEMGSSGGIQRGIFQEVRGQAIIQIALDRRGNKRRWPA